MSRWLATNIPSWALLLGLIFGVVSWAVLPDDRRGAGSAV